MVHTEEIYAHMQKWKDKTLVRKEGAKKNRQP